MRKDSKRQECNNLLSAHHFLGNFHIVAAARGYQVDKAIDLSYPTVLEILRYMPLREAEGQIFSKITPLLKAQFFWFENYVISSRDSPSTQEGGLGSRRPVNIRRAALCGQNHSLKRFVSALKLQCISQTDKIISTPGRPPWGVSSTPFPNHNNGCSPAYSREHV